MYSPLQILAFITVFSIWGSFSHAQILPTTESEIRVTKTKTVRLTQDEISNNQDWGFMWHWLNKPSHHEYKDALIKKFPTLTYQDGTVTKFKRPMIEGLDEDKQSEKFDHFLTRDQLNVYKLDPFFTAARKLFCNDPDNTADAYCEKDANRRKVWEEQTQDHLLKDLDFEELGTHGTFRHANHALIMHKYLECEEEKSDMVGLTFNLGRLKDQLFDIGYHLEQTKYAEKPLEDKRERTLNRIKKVLGVDVFSTPKPTPVEPAARKLSISAQQETIAPKPETLAETKPESKTGIKPSSTQVEATPSSPKVGRATLKPEQIKLQKKAPQASPALGEEEVEDQLSQKSVGKRRIKDNKETSHSDRLQQEPEQKLEEFMDRLSMMTWPERRKIFQDDPLHLFHYYNTISDEERDKLSYEERHFYFEKFVPIQEVFSKKDFNPSAQDSDSYDALIAALSKPDLSESGHLSDPNPNAIKELTEWAEKTGKKLKTTPGGKRSKKLGDLVAAVSVLESRAAFLKVLTQNDPKKRISFTEKSKNKRILREEFHELKAIRKAIEKLEEKQKKPKDSKNTELDE
jgi:hypothetical protein